MEFEIERAGHKFEFKTRLEGKNVKLMYKMDGKANKWNDKGYFGTKSYDEKTGVVRFSNLKIDGKKVDGVKLNDIELEEKIMVWKESEIIKQEKEYKEARSVEVKKLYWAKGGHYYKDLIIITDFKNRFGVMTEQIEEIETALKYIDEDELREASKKLSKDFAGEHGYYAETQDGFWELNVDAEIIKKAFKLREAALEKEHKKIEEKEAKRQAIFDKAKETGEKQELRRTMVECMDETEECDWDIVIEYAMPDGSRTLESQHTW